MKRTTRCLAAIGGQAVDRLPTYLPGMACDVASALLGRKAHAGTGSLHYAEACAWMKGDSAHAEFEEQLLIDLADLYRALDIDVYRMPWRERTRPARQLDPFTFVYGDPDGDHVVSQYSPDSGDFGAIRSVHTGAVDFDAAYRRGVESREAEIAGGALEKVGLPDEQAMLCRRFGGEFFVVCNGGGLSAGWGADSLMLLASDPDLVRRSVMIQAREAVALARALASAPVSCPPVFVAGGDLAGQAGPLYSPAAFRSVMLPALRHAMAEMRRIGAHYVFRSDGNLWPVADMLFGEAECPGYGEVDRDAGMTMGELRKRFPRLVVWGNMSVARLASLSEAQAREEARRIVDESGGTACFQGPSNAIVKGTPPRNVEALFAAR